MPKSVSVTVTLSFSADVPKSWKADEDLEANVQDALNIDIKSTEKKVVIGDVSVDEITVEEEE